MARNRFHRGMGGVTVAALLIAAGCSSTPSSPESDPSVVAEPDIQAEVEAQAQRLDQALKAQKRAPQQAAVVLPQSSPAVAVNRPAKQVAAPVVETGPDEPAEPMGPPAPPAAPVSSKAMTDMASKLAGDDRPLAEALRLALAQTLGDTSGDKRLRELEGKLTESQTAKLCAFRSMLGDLSGTEELPPEELARRMRERATALEPEARLSIPTAVLATKVDGYGKFTPMGTQKFLAGRAQVVLVYVEVKGYGYKETRGTSEPIGFDVKPAAGEAQWAIELTQELRLYHQADGVLAWHAREQSSRDVSRRKRTDHYLVQRVTLPSTLTVGAYTMKVILKDSTNGSVVESQIPFEVVVDASLTRTELR